MEPEVKYGLEVTTDEDGHYWGTVYKITTDDTGVWVDNIGTFRDKDTAHAFIRAWNGEETPV
jgi:hypothetical protein